jgi:hypothetical protein
MAADKQTIPYTYLIGWPDQNLWYYGVRYAAGCHPSDLWNPYTTSSNYVAAAIGKYGIPLIRIVRKTFRDSNSARLWENKVLKRMKVVINEKWLNKTDNKSIPPMYGLDNPATKSEVRSKISYSVKQWYQNNHSPNLGTTTSVLVKEKQSKAKLGELNPFYGKNHSKENLQLFSDKQKDSNNSFYGKSHSDETRQKMSDDRKGKLKPTSQCPHCDKIGGINTMSRWHFDNCKELKDDN